MKASEQLVPDSLRFILFRFPSDQGVLAGQVGRLQPHAPRGRTRALGVRARRQRRLAARQGQGIQTPTTTLCRGSNKNTHKRMPHPLMSLTALSDEVCQYVE